MEIIMKKYTVTESFIPENVSLHGLTEGLVRMPAEAADRVSKNVSHLSRCGAGGRLRFATDSERLRLDVTLESGNVNCAVDVLCDGRFIGRILPDVECDPIFGGELTLGRGGEIKNVTVFISRTAHTRSLDVSVDDGAGVYPAAPYAIKKPVVFYGSSITMGAISSSPSKAYTALVAERLCADHVNLGFGGSALGETAMAEYIAGLEMSAFVLDYEHNAPTLDHLRGTHKPFFDIIRKAHPTLPILIVSRPDTDGDFIRACTGRRIIMDTFHKALDAGDRFVDFVDGFYLWGNEERRTCCAEDGCHPNDEGFARMADVITPGLRSLLKRSGTFEEEPDGNDSRFKIDL